MKIRGFAFHVHHDKLIEFCDDYEERVKYIRENKPLNEQELRLRLFKMIPQDRLPPVLNEARKACDKAWKAYDEAWKAYDEVRKACNEAGKACGEARKAYDEVRKACEPEIIKLHEELCPDCPWNGYTIFSNRN